MGMRPRIVAALLAIAITSVAGCGGGDNDDDDDATDPTTETTAADATGDESSDTTIAEVDEDAEATAAMDAVVQFFSLYSTGDFAGAAALMENGPAHLDEYQTLFDTFDVGNNALGAAAKSATITGDEGEVVYDLSFGGTVALPDSSALVVKIDGEWLFSESSWNALVALVPPDTTTVP